MEKKINDQKKSENSIHSWFGWILATIIVLVICIKILYSDFNLSQIQFSFTDLMSLIIALFAIWISINFYHKNNEASAKFYNNTYTFSKDIAENLGRIEERFGEKLESIKEDNKTLSSRVEKYYSKGSPIKRDIVKDDEKEKEIQEKLKKELEEKDKLINEIAEKYEIVEQDKNQFLKRIEDKNEEVQKLEKKLKLFERSREEIDNRFNVPTRIINYLRHKLLKSQSLRSNLFIESFIGDDSFKNLFYKKSRTFHRSFLKDLILYDLVDEDEKLNENGIKLVMSIIQDIDS